MHIARISLTLTLPAATVLLLAGCGSKATAAANAEPVTPTSTPGPEYVGGSSGCLHGYNVIGDWQ